MRRHAVFLAACLVGCSGSGLAADLDEPLRPSLGTDPVGGGARWQGFNIGVNAGGVWTQGNRATQVWYPPGFAGARPPGGPYSFSSLGGMGGAQMGYNSQWGGFVFGGEADFDFVDATAKKNAAGRFMGMPYTAVQTQKLQALGTIRARVGYALFDDVLVYGTAGLAFGQTQLSSNLTFSSVAFTGSHTDVQVGLAAGGGIEYALGPEWSVGAEFLYYDLGNGHVASTSKLGADVDTSAPLRGYTLRAGLNYDFDGPGDATVNQFVGRDITVRFGARAGMSTSNARMTLSDASGQTRISRLTYHDPTAPTGEVFGQIDDLTGVFMKGYAGVGKENGGTLQDEDFPPLTRPYSSTNSPQKDGRLGYASADVGYYGLVSSWYKLGPFAGYHYLDERFNAFGCTQTARNSICSPGQVGPSNLTISDEGRWQSVRLGVAGQATLPYGFTVRAEAAWLPMMAYHGGNDHWLREPTDFNGTIPETATGYFDGVQLEGEADYAVSKNFDIGAGVRFWSMDAKGHVLFGAVTNGETQVATFTTQRVQAFVQSAYHF